MSEASATLPIVDLSTFFTNNGGGNGEFGTAGARLAEKQMVVEQIGEACSEYGFFQIVNHGVPKELMKEALELSGEFFGFSAEEKLKLAVKPDASVPAGYAKQPEHSPNKNEFFAMVAPGSACNVYPTHSPKFREVMDGIYGHMVETARLIESILSESLGLAPHLLRQYNEEGKWDVMTAFHYFPSGATAGEGTGLYAHKDLNSINMVMQDDVGGLEVLKDGQWIPIAPIPYAIVVNVGDIIQVLSNDIFKSATHRVLSPIGKHRFSFAFSYMVGMDHWVKPLPEVMKLQTKDSSPKFRGFVFKDYFLRRIENLKNPPLDLNDVITIAHYAIPSPVT